MRRFQRLAALVATLACASCGPPLCADEARPNVLFIAVDDLNDWIGCMQGHPQAKTPNIDRLAARGVLFTNAHCAAPICLASRTAVFSGRYPQETGVYNNDTNRAAKPLDAARQMTVHFQTAGYRTLGTGKLYHASQPKLFDEFFDTEQRWSPFTNEQMKYSASELPSKGTAQPRHVIYSGPGGRDWTLPFNGLPSERAPAKPDGESFDWGPVDVADEEMGDTRITSWAIKKLAESQTKPLWLGVGYYRPHIPLFAPQRDFDALPPLSEIKLPEVDERDLDDLGAAAKKLALEANTAGTHELVQKGNQWREAVRAYLACVTFVDRQVGRLLAALDESPLADNTWIVFWGDHGWHFGDKQHWGKWTPWRQATRVPLIIVPPRGKSSPRGVTCAEPVSLVDLFPTLLEACRLPPRSDLSGVSLVPLLNNPAATTDRVVLTTIDPGNYALSARRWRYLRYHTGEEEFYEIKADPHEWHNLAASPKHERELADMRRQLDATLRRFKDQP